MKRLLLVVAALGLLAAVLVLGVLRRVPEPRAATPSPSAPAPPPSAPAEADPAQAGFLYGRVTTTEGETYQGRLRWGGSEEAFWGDYFNGYKEVNPWASQVPPERLKERRPITVFGIQLAVREREVELGRPFVARFGDIVRIEANGAELGVTLKSGRSVLLDRFNADDLADGLRVWDEERGVVDFGERRLRLVEMLPTPALGEVPARLYGTVHTWQGDFTGFVQWHREASVATDELTGESPGGTRSLPFGTIGSIARSSPESSRVTLSDGGAIELSGHPEVGRGNRGVYVDDPRYGRVLVSWDAFQSLDFASASNSGPAYEDFPPGGALAGTVTRIDGRRLAGRLVFDLDESETTETLDAPSRGIHYSIPLGLVASIGPGGAPERARLTLHGGEELEVERGGDLGEGNGGMLVFVEGQDRPEHVPWSEVERVDFER